LGGVILAGGLVAAGVGALLLVHGSLLLAVGFCVLPLLVWLLGRPQAGLILLGASIPITYSLTAGAGLNVAPSDLLLVFVGAGLFFEAAIAGSLPSLRALRGIKSPLMQYGIFLVLLLAVHLSVSGAAQTVQRFELFLLPLMVGAFATLSGRQFALLRAYVLAACVIAVSWPFVPALGQKNPVGQMIGNALLLLVGAKELRRYAPLALVLIPGLAVTGSRGAVVATAIGIIVIFALQETRAKSAFGRLSVVAVIAVVTYSLLPVSLQARLTTFTAGTNSRSAYALHIRQQYVTDAERIIRAHPIAGIGVGNYLAGNSADLTSTTDPHNVLLLQAAEGGYGFPLSFALLIGAILVALRRMNNVLLAPVAAAVLLATFAHGLVDVYWVRGTPVLSWLLVGMACAAFAQQRERTEERA
jgi:hypothetical protein